MGKIYPTYRSRVVWHDCPMPEELLNRVGTLLEQLEKALAPLAEWEANEGSSFFHNTYTELCRVSLLTNWGHANIPNDYKDIPGWEILWSVEELAEHDGRRVIEDWRESLVIYLRKK